MNGKIGSGHGSDENPVLNVQTDNVKQSVPAQFTAVMPDGQTRIIDDGGGTWTIVKPWSCRGSRSSTESGRTSSAHNKGHREQTDQRSYSPENSMGGKNYTSDNLGSGENSELEQTLWRAERSLSIDDRAQIWKRMATMTMALENSSRTTQDEKTLGKKGKGVDPETGEGSA